MSERCVGVGSGVAVGSGVSVGSGVAVGCTVGVGVSIVGVIFRELQFSKHVSVTVGICVGVGEDGILVGS